MSLQVSSAICASFSRKSDESKTRHEKPVDNGLANQNMQDRYHGRNDPVARKIMTQHADAQGLAAPEDTSIVGRSILARVMAPY